MFLIYSAKEMSTFVCSAASILRSLVLLVRFTHFLLIYTNQILYTLVLLRFKLINYLIN